MSLNAEIRWFWPHATPSAFAVWFRSSVHHDCMVGGGRSYTGTHMPWDGHPRWDIRRQGGSISIRAQQSSTLHGCDVRPFEGDVAFWFDLISKHSPPSGSVSVDLVGRRWMRLFDTGERKPREIRLASASAPASTTVPELGPRCEVDLAEYELGDFGGRWATLGLTARGPSETLLHSIRSTAAVLRDRRAPDLEDAFVSTFPQWILSLSPFWRHSAVLQHARAGMQGEHRPTRRAELPTAWPPVSGVASAG